MILPGPDVAVKETVICKKADDGLHSIWKVVDVANKNKSGRVLRNTMIASDSSKSITTSIFLFVRKSHSQSFMLLSIPDCLSILYNNFL